MSKLVTDSQRRLALRAKLPTKDRDTLLPCLACNGEGQHLTEKNGSYRQSRCRWCQGIGAVGALMIAAWNRWQRIKLANKLAGRCL